MATDFRQFDEHGFPIAPKFEALKYHEDEAPRRPKITIRAKRMVLLGVLLGVIVPVMFGPQILSAVYQGVAHWFRNRAEQKFWSGDYAGAIADLGHAIGWSPHAPVSYFLRAQCREEIDDLNGSLDDWNQLIAMPPSELDELDRYIAMRSSDEPLPVVYRSRSWIYVRLERYQEAIDDATRAVKLSPTPGNLNTRAYVRALANMELPDGLADINKALAATGRENNAELLDTRGYLLFLLDRKDEALKDLEKAIKLTEQYKLTIQLQRHMDDARVRLALKEANHSLAVMYHHRGLVHDKLGHKDDADRDMLRSKDLGYDPAQGVL